jgi:hypothetical protein
MFGHKRGTKKGQSILEYMTLVVFILSAFFVSQQYIVRAFSGNWKRSGDSFAHGEQYDPRAFGNNGDQGGSAECFFSPRINAWVDRDCYHATCGSLCSLYSSVPGCVTCANGCASAVCQGN